VIVTINNKKIHMVSWDMVCRPKDKGGLGVKASSQMNQAMLAKLSWRMFQKQEGLWNDVLQKKKSAECFHS
jgi:hypothetical protein